jgi:hypothetical protein
MHSAFGKFPVDDLDSLTIRLMFEIARTGDMVIITEGGRYPAILTDPAQLGRLPKEWHRGDRIRVCSSPEQLVHLLSDWYALQAGFRERAISDWRQSVGEPTSIPGSRPESPASYVYLEARLDETATKQQKRLYRHKVSGRCPKSGIMMSQFWRLETPGGQAFYAYSYGGDKENWLGTIRDFAASEGRTVGRIENSDTFVQDDGRRFPLAACTCTKVKE